ncbi:hypothetical protein AUP68_11953 [Ilyonectria robusta]
MLYATHGPHSDPARLEAIVRRELGPLIELRDTSPHKIDDYLGRVIDCAINVDFRVHAMKAAASFEMREPETLKLSGFAYKGDPNVMVRYYGSACDDGLPVHFIIRPRLQIYGVFDWAYSVNLFHRTEPFYDDYDQRTIVPMEVAVGLFDAEDREL